MTNSQRATEMCRHKYTGELNILCGILGREEELNNHGRQVTHEANSAITKYTDWIYIDNLTIKNGSNYRVLSADRLENRIAREQV